ncbi:MAG: hypothetical protein ICV78_02360 [Tolypothrix sp. Co-bin9]|nr:hypothetical protein [Tolypothrix sp. Co-bin9]
MISNQITRRFRSSFSDAETLREQVGRADGRCVSAGKPAFFAVASLGKAASL